MYATLNITYAGQNGTMPSEILFDLSDQQVKDAAAEALAAGGIPGINAQGPVDFSNFEVGRFAAVEAQGDAPALPNRLVLRPKTAFGR